MSIILIYMLMCTLLGLNNDDDVPVRWKSRRGQLQMIQSGEQSQGVQDNSYHLTSLGERMNKRTNEQTHELLNF